MGKCVFHQEIDRTTADAHEFADEVAACGLLHPDTYEGICTFLRKVAGQSNAAGPKLGLTTQAFPVRSLTELDGAFDAMAKAGMQAVVVNAESLFYPGREMIAKLAIARHLPTCVWVREVVEAGTLLSYGADQRAISRRVAVYVDRILKGEKPADIPVEQPTRFELIVNAKTAKALGITIPQTLLLRTDDVIL